jgi:hypothetical protein
MGDAFLKYCIREVDQLLCLLEGGDEIADGSELWAMWSGAFACSSATMLRQPSFAHMRPSLTASGTGRPFWAGTPGTLGTPQGRDRTGYATAVWHHLASTLLPAVVLIDERDARREARRRGWPVMGTLGLVRAAADHRIEGLDLAEALARLRRTNFRAGDAVFAEILRDA